MNQSLTKAARFSRHLFAFIAFSMRSLPGSERPWEILSERKPLNQPEHGGNMTGWTLVGGADLSADVQKAVR
jgi:hypothetical protein